MASGDTKTDQYLDIAANGTRADLPTDTCCETRTQSLIRGVAERIIGVEEEVQELENNPDVVDIVATYADLQAYDTSSLTDKDIIRVLEDSTHNNNSTYYRWISGGSSVNVVQTTGTSTTDVMSQNATTGMVFTDPSSKEQLRIGGGNVRATSYGVALGYDAHAQGLNSTAIGHSATSGSASGIAIGNGATTSGSHSIAIGTSALANVNRAIAIGAFASASQVGEINVGSGVQNLGYNNTNYRLLTGLYDPQSAHDAATKGYVDANAGSLILYASAAEIIDESTIQFYDAADLDHSVSIGTIHAAVSSGRDIKIIARNSIETDWSERTIYTIYKAYYPKTCTDESMDEIGMILCAIGGLGTQAPTRKAIAFQTFSGPAYNNFVVGIESF